MIHIVTKIWDCLLVGLGAVIPNGRLL